MKSQRNIRPVSRSWRPRNVKVPGWMVKPPGHDVQKNQTTNGRVFQNGGGPPKSSILIGFSIINHPFWGTPIFGNTQIYITKHLAAFVFLRSRKVPTPHQTTTLTKTRHHAFPPEDSWSPLASCNDRLNKDLPWKPKDHENPALGKKVFNMFNLQKRHYAHKLSQAQPFCSEHTKVDQHGMFSTQLPQHQNGKAKLKGRWKSGMLQWRMLEECLQVFALFKHQIQVTKYKSVFSDL